MAFRQASYGREFHTLFLLTRPKESFYMVKHLLSLLGVVLLLQTTQAVQADDAAPQNIIDTMDAATFTGANAKAHVDVVPGKVGNALKFTFANDSMNAMLIGRAAGRNGITRRGSRSG